MFLAIILVMRNRWNGIAQLLERGELLLISAVLLATAFGDLLASDTHMKRTKMFVGALTLLFGAAAAVWYAIILDCLMTGGEYPATTVVYCSVVIFGSTLVIGLACVMLSTEGK